MSKKPKKPLNDPKGKAVASGSSSSSGSKPKKQKEKELEHFLSPEEIELHFCVSNNAEGGKCICYHRPECDGYQEKSCCYRWQAHQIAIERDSFFYNVSADEIRQILEDQNGPTYFIGTSAYKTRKGKIQPPYYGYVIPVPEYEKDWYLDGPDRPAGESLMAGGGKPIPDGKNFQHDTWPYWNNAHHLISKGTLWSMINGGDKPFELMRKALLKAKYNVHHKSNMLLIPMDREVGKLLGMARHLKLETWQDKTNHPIYNDKVQTGLTKIIDDYKKICEAAVKEKPHETPIPDLDKTKLERLSGELRRWVIIEGIGSPGTSLDELAT
jgi:hypothetical protein